MLDFARLKAALSPADGRLLAVLASPAAAPGGEPALLSLTGWDAGSLRALLTQFFGSTDPASLADATKLARVYDAFAVVRTCGLSASAVIAAITNAPTAATVSALQSALRARYTRANWLTAVGPINDAARIASRDALVAYILQQFGDAYARSVVVQATSAGAGAGATSLTIASTTGLSAGMTVQGPGIATGSVLTSISAPTVTLSVPTLAALPSGTALTFVPAGAQQVATADMLYAMLLIDTQTQPPVRTSRIRLALSAIQLFIERVLRNLEPQVAADGYRPRFVGVDEALPGLAGQPGSVPVAGELALSRTARRPLADFPPDDERAAAERHHRRRGGHRLPDYLTEPGGGRQAGAVRAATMRPATGDTENSGYVVARTAGAHRKYYFRALSGSWTPWTEIKIDCEDMP